MKIAVTFVFVICSLACLGQRKIVVAADGSGDYKTVQAAFNAIRPSNAEHTTVYIKNGVYREKLQLDSLKRFVTLLGEDKFRTVLTYDDHSGKLSPRGDTINTRTSASFFMYADDFTAMNITFRNDAGPTAGQAVAVEVDGHRAAFRDCRFIGDQDVLLTNDDNSIQYYENCYIEGTTDFIFGSSTAWFEKCHIHCKKNSHITAASTPQHKMYGYVFNDCVITGDTTLNSVSLGRPWRPFANVIFMRSYLDRCIRKEGWSVWNKNDNYKTARYAEYENFGPGASSKTRLSWTRQLSEEEGARVTLSAVLGNWRPFSHLTGDFKYSLHPNLTGDFSHSSLSNSTEDFNEQFLSNLTGDVDHSSQSNSTGDGNFLSPASQVRGPNADGQPIAFPRAKGPDSDALPIAFPGAEGFGKFATGGRGGKVIKVTNLNDDGPGSLRKALQTNNAKTIVFEVSGTIHLNSKLLVKSNTTIAGQTAPGDGICIADHPVSLNGDNIIVRFIRFRMGDKNQRGGMVHGNGSDDAFGGVRNKNLIIDHCSISWSTDEVFSVYQGDSTTLQWNLISEPLNYSYHFEAGDKDYEHHGFGGIWGGRHLSGHHNLFAHCASRTPRFDGNRNTDSEFVDFRNNVIYNWGNNNVYAGEGGTYNIVNNYYKPGPATKASVKERIANPFKSARLPYGKFFIAGNFMYGSPGVSKDNWTGVTMDKGNADDAAKSRLNMPHASIPIPEEDALTAFQRVLKFVGATKPARDTLDERIINDVINGLGRLIDVQGGFPHGTAYEQTKNAWPALKSFPAPRDTDGDGIPDEWEKKHGLGFKNARDASAFTLHPFYTNLELYINSLAGQR